MADFDDLLAANREYAEKFDNGGFDGVAHAGVAIVTCMDSRIEPLALLGDYNVIPEPRDAEFPKNWVQDALFQPESREAFRALKWLGFSDAYLQADGAPGAYTFWDYQAGAWQRNNGIRIDHALLSPQAADALKSVVINRDVRGWDKPSDHVPLMTELAD